jgi:epoxyqueuosine reductase
MFEDELISKAYELGFLACGIAKAEKLQEHEDSLHEWLKNGYQGEMGYMERNIEKRLDPRELVKGTKSIICLAYNYFPNQLPDTTDPKIAKYAWGEDYHRVVKDKCYELLDWIRSQYPTVHSRVFVDSAPVMERQWALKAGIGWIGKNSLLLRKGVGSNFFLAEIFLDLELNNSEPYSTQHCGDCTACIDACPTQAIVQDGVIDSNKCISYLTIEKRSELNPQEKEMLNNWVFGCDVCQDVCPWNRFSQPHQEPRFTPYFSKNRDINWVEMNEEQFKEIFGKSPLTRMGFEKFKQLYLFQQGKA